MLDERARSTSTGEKMTQEQLAALYRRVQTTKAAQAHELLAKRTLNKEK